MEASGVATMPFTRPAWARCTCEEPAARSQILAVPSMDPASAPEVSGRPTASISLVATKLLLVPSNKAWSKREEMESAFSLRGLTSR